MGVVSSWQFRIFTCGYNPQTVRTSTASSHLQKRSQKGRKCPALRKNLTEWQQCLNLATPCSTRCWSCWGTGPSGWRSSASRPERSATSWPTWGSTSPAYSCPASGPSGWGGASGRLWSSEVRREVGVLRLLELDTAFFLKNEKIKLIFLAILSWVRLF